MNDRVIELARQVWTDPNISHTNHAKFAETLLRDVIGQIRIAQFNDEITFTWVYDNLIETIADRYGINLDQP